MSSIRNPTLGMKEIPEKTGSAAMVKHLATLHTKLIGDATAARDTAAQDQHQTRRNPACTLHHRPVQPPDFRREGTGTEILNVRTCAPCFQNCRQDSCLRHWRKARQHRCRAPANPSHPGSFDQEWPTRRDSDCK